MAQKAAYRTQKLYNPRTQTATGVFKKTNKKEKKDSNLFLLSCPLSTLSVMARVEQVKSTQLNRDCTKARKGITAPISLKDGAICELSVLDDPSN